MGARLSQPRAPGGTTESSIPTKPAPPPNPKNPFPRGINSRTIVAPAAAFTMALILFVYTRTSIRAAKANAQRHRDADTGGEGLSLLNEHRRRHGLGGARRLEEGEGMGGTVGELGRELFGGKGKEGEKGEKGVGVGRSEEEERLRALKGRRGGGS
ncbi:hypothetical protein CBER1_03130 [Lecanosticta acicola]|uniref:Uncharacterized protein n=1 Tax=Lecanosticta acicola TaxID=111012 RepID=A0AAI8YTW3_9PEZI|nr:hypothetical protein CBER1_03130 [Lecanosticta acicola]